MMHLSRILFGAWCTAPAARRAHVARIACTARRASLSVRALCVRGATGAAAACVLLAGAAACSGHDVRSDVQGDSPGGAASGATAPSHTPSAAANGGSAYRAVPVSGGGSAPGRISQTATTTSADTLLASADVYAGWRSFNVNCQSCHGFNAVASDVAPDLRNSVRMGGTVTRVQFQEVVRKGRMAKGMPAWGALLDAKQIDQIYAYLLARSSGALGAGRPNVGGE